MRGSHNCSKTKAYCAKAGHLELSHMTILVTLHFCSKRVFADHVFSNWIEHSVLSEDIEALCVFLLVFRG